MKNVREMMENDPYLVVLDNREPVRREAVSDNRALLMLWNKICKEVIEGLDKSQRAEEARALENDKNKDKYGTLKSSIQKSIDYKYNVNRKLMEVINSNVQKICSGNLGSEYNITSVEILYILRNLPPKYTKVVLDAVRRDQSICDKKCNAIFQKLLMIANANKTGPTLVNYNKKALLKLGKMCKRQCSEETIMAIFATGKRETTVDNLSTIFRKMVSNAKIVTKGKPASLLISPSHLEEDFIGKVDVMYFAEQKQLLKYRNTSKNDKINQEIDEYIELYDKWYIYNSVAGDLEGFLQEKSTRDLQLTNTIKAIQFLVNKLRHETQIYEKQLKVKLKLITARIEKDDYQRGRESSISELKAAVERENKSSKRR